VPADVLCDSADALGDCQQMYWVAVSADVLCESADVLDDCQQMYWVTVSADILGCSDSRCIV
jgi:hypothetical protein